jgi:conjugal transfer pilus assembly protein TraK
MRNSYFILCGVVLSLSAHAMTQQSFHENADLSINLSNTNYNRLVVKQDKITRAHFPEGSMAVKGEEDGSLYVIVARSEPFTMFLTTANGHHFSATVHSESALGKTLEFIPIQQAMSQKITPSVVPPASHDFMISNLMNEMMNQKEITGFEIKHHYGRAIRGNYGFVLLPKLTYDGIQLKGEVIELYNRSTKPINLDASWFTNNTVKAISFSKTSLSPKEHAMLYRITEKNHG